MAHASSALRRLQHPDLPGIPLYPDLLAPAQARQVRRRFRFSVASLDWALVLPSLLIAFVCTLGISRSAEEPGAKDQRLATRVQSPASPGAQQRPPPESVPAEPTRLEPAAPVDEATAHIVESQAPPTDTLDRQALHNLVLQASRPPVPAQARIRITPERSAETERRAKPPAVPNPTAKPSEGSNPKMPGVPSFKALAGTWAPRASACPKRSKGGGEFIPVVISAESAVSESASCAFERKRPDGAQWQVVARCSNAQDQWTANIRLALANERLEWTSERGRQTYLRCS